MFWNVNAKYCDFFPLSNSLICCFLSFFFLLKIFFFFFLVRYNVSIVFYLITGDADSIEQCWKVALKRFWEERDPRKHLLSLHTFPWRLSAVLWGVRKCMLCCDHAELQLVRKRGAFDSHYSVTQLCMLDWKQEKKPIFSLVTANQLYAVVAKTVDVKLNVSEEKAGIQ